MRVNYYKIGNEFKRIKKNYLRNIYEIFTKYLRICTKSLRIYMNIYENDTKYMTK